MTRVLDYKRRGPEVGQATSLVILLHGYGADGNDLLGLADPLGEHLPGTAFVAPDAPEQCVANPMGFQWFPIPWIDGSDPVAAEEGMMAAAGDLDAFLDQIAADEEVPSERTILLGFSQGTMMALHVAPKRRAPYAGIVGVSGRLLRPEELEETVRVRPSVLLMHGDQDEVVPPESMPEAAQALQDAGFDVYAHVMQGTGHGIAPDGLSLALAFMRERLGLESAG
ncbi:phospholipase/carboxylesterase [Tranquillimonas rosea]|uniref:Phospholipase/carboxylesterase n=1 Tax=Tranquillimonas rosea TaxID=641238 RepID=A0A1H9TI89_9RHOB|nr:alpha/beta fold hydrolase [Tranquillimonas rosea]SER96579.1 phospholipase/carboxylesterase [Tranquillimonas rosea]